MKLEVKLTVAHKGCPLYYHWPNNCLWLCIMHDSTSYWGVRGRCLFASSVGWLKMNESIVRVLFIGAGAVNFGGTIGPWDHSRRLEQLGGVQVVAIADPDLPKAQEVLKSKLDGQFADMYKGCIVMANYLDAIETTKPHVAFIGK